ncbi:hypothetical protein ACS0PU_002818 [Formica fusca]
MTGDWKFYHPESVHSNRIKFSHVYRSAVSSQGKEYFPRQDIKRSTVFDLVYRYLHKCADRDKKWKRNCACNRFYKQHARKRSIHGRDAPTSRTNFKEEIFDEQLKPNKFVLHKRMSRSSSKEYIADYTKAVRDGRRRAKLYVQEALLYGLQSGLLIPIDRHRNILYVSQKLGVFSPKNVKDLYQHQ